MCWFETMFERNRFFRSNVGATTQEHNSADDVLAYQLPPIFETDARRKIRSCKILISGLNGLGAEIAKNLVLTGFRYISLHDTRVIGVSDLATSYLFCDDDIGKNRAEIYSTRLSELREHANVTTHIESLNETNVKNFDLVCMTEADSLEHIISTNNICRAQKVSFVFGEVFGAFGFVFNDFGSTWQSTNLLCQKSDQLPIEDIKGDAMAPSLWLDIDSENRVRAGSQIVFRNLPQLPQLNNRKYNVVNTLPSISLITADNNTDTTPIQYTYGGFIEEAPISKEFQFHPFSELLTAPNDSNKFKPDKPVPVEKISHHRALVQSLYKFKQKHQQLPKPWNEDDAKEVLDEVTAGLRISEWANNEYLMKLAKVSSCHLAPLIQFFGGVLSHEVLKCVTNMGTPIDQVLFFDAEKCLPNITEADITLTGTRDDALTQLFGNKLARQIQDAHVLLGGVGGIGSEILKTLGLMGVAGHETGLIKVMDCATVNAFQLTTKSLCHTQDIGKKKAKVAIERVKKLNPNLKAKYMTEDMVEYSNLPVSDVCWNSADVIFNTMGNGITSRYGRIELRVQDKAIFFRKPLIECQVVDASAHNTICVPFTAEPSMARYYEEDWPIIKPKSTTGKYTFPSTIAPCVEYAHTGLFTAKFHDLPSWVENFVSVASYINALHEPSLHLDRLKKLHKAVLHLPKDFEDCVRWARKLFQKVYYRNVLRLLHVFPLDSVDTAGQPLWKGKKTPPTPITFNVEDPLHLSFIETAAMLYAEMYHLLLDEYAGLDATDRNAFIKKITLEMKFPSEYVHQSKNTTEAEDLELLFKLKDTMPARDSVKKLKVLAYDKYNERHVSFVHFASSLRARAYSIPTVERWETMRLAGNIVPKLASTCSSIAGLSCIEYIKMRLGHTKLEQLSNNFVNLNTCFFTEHQPLPVQLKQYQGLGMNMSKWDRIEIRESLTLQGLLEYFKEKGLVVDMVGCDTSLIYACYQRRHTTPDYLNQSLYNLLKSRSCLRPDQEYALLVLTATDSEDNDVEDLPQVVYYLTSESLHCEM